MTDGIIEVVHERDPNIDWAAIPGDVLERWKESRATALLTPYVRPGKQPIIFRLREISHSLFDAWVTHANSPGTASDPEGGATTTTYRRAFQAALVLVKNMPSRDGVIRPEWEPPKVAEPGLFQGVLTEEGANAFTASMRYDMGAVAYQRMGFLPGTEPTFHRPRMCQDLLGPPPLRSAAPSSPSQAQPSATQSPDAAAA